MLKIEHGVGSIVASDSSETLRAIDDALLLKSRLCSTIIEASQQSHLPANESQRLFQSMAEGFHLIVDGRAKMVSTLRTLTSIKDRSTLEVTDFGCPNGVQGNLSEVEPKRTPVTVG